MRKIPLTQGQFALVDHEDFERLNKFKWFAAWHRNTFYARRRCPITKVLIHMHREVLYNKDNLILIDHKDRNGLNNQKTNLRICTQSQNNSNTTKRKSVTSQYLGVSRRTDNGKWKAEIRKNYIGYRLGDFINEEDAAKAYNVAAIKLHGEFARLNII